MTNLSALSAYRRSSVPILLGLAVGCTLAVSVQGHQATPAPAWSYASSAHFEVYAEGNERHARQAIADFERFNGFFERVLNVRNAAPTRTRLVVFATAAEFAPYRTNDNAGAFY